MQTNYQTDRLILSEVNLTDDQFIKELVNTPAWIRFIGERNIKTLEDSQSRIKKLLNDPNIHYLVVKLRDQDKAIGVVSFIKREYLDFHDLGFAFLPEYTKKGYAYEAAKAVLDEVVLNSGYPKILATTVKENLNSIHLLEKLGFRFDHKVESGGHSLLVYAISVDKIQVDNLTKDFFHVFCNSKGKTPDWDKIHQLCLPETLIVKKLQNSEEIYTLASFIEPRKLMLSDGTITEFEEYETFEETNISGNIAQRFSKYQKQGLLQGNHFQGSGNKFFLFVKTNEGWKISSMVWEDEL